LIAAGQGVGIVPCFVAAALVRLTDDVLAQNELFAVVHEDQRDVPRVRVVLDYLVDALARERVRFSGRVTRA
jgi:DNA-binding transcriptional LysR family regulator